MSNKFTPSTVVESQIPRYIRESDPLFVKFIQYYYKFLEQSKIQDIIQDVLKYNDNDSVDLAILHSYYEEFKALPNTISADPRLVAKFVYDLYKSKGTATATNLLFKILYGEEVSVSYPSKNVLRASVGNWVKDTVLTLSVTDGAMSLTTNIIQVTSVFGNYQYPIEFIEAIPNSNSIRIFVHLPNNFVISNNTVYLYTDSTLDVTATLIDTPNDVIIDNGGRDWKVGQLIVFPSTEKRTIVQVKKVNSIGTITQIAVVQYGFDGNTDPYIVSPYENQLDTTNTPPAVPDSVTFNASKATLRMTFATQVTSPGYFRTLDGMLSVPDMCLEDNFFYQTFSYVINSQHQIPEFENSLKIIHPAGVKYFAETAKTISFSVPISVIRQLV